MKFTYMLAPMEDVTDSAFRSICHRYGADITFTEMAKVDALARKNASTWQRIKMTDKTPTIIQIVGHKEDALKKFLSIFQPQDGFCGFNLNLGCPSPEVVNLGSGCAMIKRISKTQNLVKAIKDCGYKASIKMRLGLNRYEKEKKAYLNLINAVDADFFVVHARHGTESYESPADFRVYPECVKTGKTIIANGDVTEKETVDALKEMGIKGAMIGRLAISNPAIFNILQGANAPDIESIKKEYLILAEKFKSHPRYKKNVLKFIGREYCEEK